MSAFAAIEPQLRNVPDAAKLKRISEFGNRVLEDSLRHQKPEKVLAKPYAWKRNLVEHCFAGTDAAGRRLGVYVKRTGKTWQCEIRGILEKVLTIEPFGTDGEFEVLESGKTSSALY
jgi:hypothetical protein